MKKQFTLANALIAIATIGALLSWVAAVKYPDLPDGYVWSHRLLQCEYPDTPSNYPRTPIEFPEVQQKFENGTDLYRHYFHQGWWICRRNFVEQTDGFPYDENDWKYLDDFHSLPNDDFGKLFQFAMRDGNQACSQQIEILLRAYSEDDLRNQLTPSITDRYSVPAIVTILAFVIVAVKILSFNLKTPQTPDNNLLDVRTGNGLKTSGGGSRPGKR